MAGIVIFLLIRVKMLLYFLYGTYRNGNSYKLLRFSVYMPSAMSVMVL